MKTVVVTPQRKHINSNPEASEALIPHNTQPAELSEKDGASKELKLVTTHHEFAITDVNSSIAERVQWQTCAKVILQWQGGTTGPSAADTSAAGAVVK
jgi:hypothetical protein